jgi:hypothetical protein
VPTALACRSVTYARLLEFGGGDAAQVLQRTAPVVTGAAEAAAGLRAVGPLAGRLCTPPTRSITTEQLGLLRDSRELQARMQALAVQERRLPTGGADPRAPAAGRAGARVRRTRADAGKGAGSVGARAADRRAAAGTECCRSPQHAQLGVGQSTMKPAHNGPPMVLQLASERPASPGRSNPPSAPPIRTSPGTLSPRPTLAAGRRCSPQPCRRRPRATARRPRPAHDTAAAGADMSATLAPASEAHAEDQRSSPVRSRSCFGIEKLREVACSCV